MHKHVDLDIMTASLSYLGVLEVLSCSQHVAEVAEQVPVELLCQEQGREASLHLVTKLTLPSGYGRL